MGNSLKQTVGFDPSYTSPFGTLETGEITPILQGDFVHGFNTQIWNPPSVNGTGATVDMNAGRLRLQSGTGGSGNYAYFTSKKIIRYRAGQGTIARFTPIFTTGVASSLQLMGVGSVVSNAPYDGYFFGYNGTSFGIAYYNAGVLSFTPQSAWNGAKADGSSGNEFTWNPTLGSPVMIKYPYLGFGNIQFFVQHPITGLWVLVHQVRYSNTSTSIQLSNPSLQFVAFTSSSGSVTNLTMLCASVMMGISGMRNFLSNPKWAMDANKAAVGATEVPIITLKNCSSYNGVVNRGMVRLNSISFGSNNNSLATFMIKLGANISGGTISFTPINGSTSDAGVTITSGNSIISYDVGAAAISGGIYIFNTSLGQAGESIIDLTPLEIILAPGETLTISAKASANSLLGVSTNWSEDI